jgi:RimJ/RimL family protein N-acetyltransferase
VRQPDGLRTARLILRRWREEDLAPFRAMNADPQVMRFFGSGPLTAEQSDAIAGRLMSFFDTAGIGPWAVEVPGEAPFIGFVGCWPTRPELPFAPAVEIGWRLAHVFWGRGYAPEAARAALDEAFARGGISEIVSYATLANEPSRRVMRKLGMRHDPAEDFDHPLVPKDHPLVRHALYRIAAHECRRRSA